MRLAVLLCLAAVCGSALASRPDLFDASGDAGRALLQDSAACGAAIQNCNACRYQFFRGTVTRAICTACGAGFVPKALGTACWCAAGYWWKAQDNCDKCANNNWCPGSKSTPTSAIQNGCGSHMNTQSEYAKSDRECLVDPGYGWVSGTAVQCDKGYYNPGNNNRRCSKCPGGLDTSTGGQSDPTACVAPPGYYYLRGKAVACAQGSFKPDYNNTDCTQCPEGTTTEPGKVAKTAATDCAYLPPGYFANGTFTPGTTNGTLCDADSYRDTTLIYTDVKAQGCTACGAGLKTPPAVTGATSPNDCMAPPGWGFVAGANPTATFCAVGKYKAGWNREICQSCGTNYITDADATNGGAKSADECYVPAGWGAVWDGTTWVANKCPENSYGRSNVTYGLVELDCPKCIANTNTNGTDTAEGPTACGTDPGYGYYNGEATKCDYSTWNAGHNQEPCTSCGVGYNTTDLDGSGNPVGTGVDGATSSSQCVIAQGYEPDTNGTPKPCSKGYYKYTVNATACTVCPSGTTTSLETGATQLSDCDSCRAGFGADTSISTTSPACTMCGTGKYSLGVAVGAASCATCTAPSDYNGAMVSRNGITAQSECLQQFSTSDTATTNKLEWDVLSDNNGTFTLVSAASIDLCQKACKDNALCVYFQYNYASNTDCKLMLAKSGSITTSQPTFSKTAPGGSWVLLEVKPSTYVTYQMTDDAAANVGDQLGTFGTFDLAKADCDAKSTCAGFGYVYSTWRTFAGKKWLNYIGKIRTYGEHVNPWIAEPTP